ncbi:levansucrase [Streptomyces sp. HNM0645]|uniref:levansucrase n=1 Tax=Streptomyces sp. HNM0645 TaxID=2782343 RepID=UPI0024B7A5F8|nr:levansucrase [Streptomyces sp. HNM0645]MDI9883207.1 levansucrase [Streptomyces sp. HNM0645]
MTEATAVQTYLQFVEHRLTADGCAPRWEQWHGAPVLVGRRADFRLQWAATKLHLFTAVAAAPEITVPAVEAFTWRVLDYARANKGGLPVGLQTGVAAFPVLVSERVDPAAMAWAQEQQRNRFACFARPVVVDMSQGHVGFYRGTPALGRVYASHMVDKGTRYFQK